MERIVITSRAGAKIFRFTEQQKFKLIESFDNPLGREKNKAMTDDQPGLSRAKVMGASPHSLSKETDPHEVAADQFAVRLSETLKTKLNADQDLKLNIVVEPDMMGKIKKHLSEKRLEQRITWTAKDLQNVPQEKWASILNLN